MQALNKTSSIANIMCFICIYFCTNGLSFHQTNVVLRGSWSLAPGVIRVAGTTITSMFCAVRGRVKCFHHKSSFFLQTKLEKLTHLDLFGCPVTDVDDYRQSVFDLLPKLEYLDGTNKEGEDEEDDEDDDEPGLDYLTKAIGVRSGRIMLVMSSLLRNIWR